MSLFFLGTTLVEKSRMGNTDNKGLLTMFKTVVITFNVTPSSATVKCSLDESGTYVTIPGNKLETAEGNTLYYKVECDGYKTVTGTYVCNDNHTVVVSLVVDDIKTYFFRNIDSNGVVSKATGYLKDASKFKTIGEKGLTCAFVENTDLTNGVSFPNLTTVEKNGLDQTFMSCTGLNGSANFPELVTVKDYGLAHVIRSTSIASLSVPKLQTVGKYGLYYAFASTKLTNVYFDNLKTLDEYALSYAFSKTTTLKTLYFYKLETIGDYALSNMCSSCKSVEVHFPSALEDRTQCTPAYIGCSSATIKFDLT